MKAVILTASTMKKEINGITYSGKCVTAMDLSRDRVVRLVSNPQGAPIENPYCNRFHPLDVIKLSILESCPVLCQTENVLSNYKYAQFCGKYTGEIQDLYDRFCRIRYGDRSFMLDGSHKLTDISSLKHSLEIIKVSDLAICGKKCSFFYCGAFYSNVSVTDPNYKQADESELEIGDAYLVISIPTDNYDGWGYYKFVASVFPA